MKNFIQYFKTADFFSLHIFSGLKADLEKMESEINGIYSSAPEKYRKALELSLTGGKRLRPILACAAAQISPDIRRFDLVNIMTILELIHSSSLIHDDIVDRGLLRRHRPTPLKLLGPIEALWCGDYLMGRITERLWTGDCPAELGVRLADVVRQMCLGELEQRSFAWAPRKQNFDTYLHQIDSKTANLMSACCFCGGMVCSLDEKELKQLSDFGLFLGRAFQISDDILDYVPAKDNDKARGQDLKNGIIMCMTI